MATGKPDGGNGGDGGNITVEAVANKTSLLDCRYKQHFVGESGKSGKGSNKSGSKGKDTRILVPLGTQIYMEDKQTLIKDLIQPGDSILLAKGGRGGQGNACYQSSKNRSPKTMGKGDKGEELWVWLKLKISAHVAIIGFANSGKSTFFNTLSQAKSGVAPYPYTTNSPKLGNVITDYQDLIFMDTPPLGERMLLHLERCIGFVYVVSVLQDISSELNKIRDILCQNGLGKKPFVLLVSMCDLVKKSTVEEKVTALACFTLLSSSSQNKEAVIAWLAKLREE